MDELLKLVGILIVVVGFTLKLDAILIILLAAVVTALVGGLGFTGMLEIIGSSFVANRTMAIFILIMLVTGTLERNGLRESSAKLVGKFKNSTSGAIIGAYGVLRSVFGAFNINFGGVAGFVRPVIMPMAIGAVEAKGDKPNEEHIEELKGMSSGMENIAWFFCQVLFIGGPAGLLVQSTLKAHGFDVDLVDLVKVQIPVAIAAVSMAIVYYVIKDKKLRKKYYQSTNKKDGGAK